MANQLGPLSDADYKALKSQLDDLARLQVEIGKAKQAGVDMSGREEHCDYLCQRLRQLKETYFPGRA